MDSPRLDHPKETTMTPTLTPETWAQIRSDYEHSDRPVEDICAEHGISSSTLRDRMRRWHWTRRREPIPREGPPALTPPHSEAFAPPPVRAASPPLPAGAERGDQAATLAITSDANAQADAASIVPRLQSAVARVLPAIETIIARLGAEPLRPREMEQTARALGTLTRTLRELNALLAQQPSRAALFDDDDDIPEDIDEFRDQLAQKIEDFLASRADEDFAAYPPAEARPAKP
jgi:transposase-like protein